MRNTDSARIILVTGGAGFIGSNFVRYILRKYPDYQMIILDALTYAGCMDNVPHDPRVRFEFGNVCNSQLVSKLVGQCNTVIHFAAESHTTRSIFDNLIFFQTDVLGTQAVANAVLEHKSHIERFIHISTSEVYGSAVMDIMDEDHPLLPASPYAAAKVGADRLVYSYWNTYGIPAVVLRPFNNYGPYQHLEKAIPRFITSCILGEKVTVHGDGGAMRDWIYVDDTCRAIDKAMHVEIGRIKGKAVNIGTGNSISIKTIAETVATKMGKLPRDVITFTDDRPGQVERHTASTGKAKRLLDWEANVEFDEGLNDTIKWYKDDKNRAWWEKMLWMRSIQIFNKDGKKIVH
jgi:dTDP-glucose 4,6-dehydratase